MLSSYGDLALNINTQAVYFIYFTIAVFTYLPFGFSHHRRKCSTSYNGDASILVMNFFSSLVWLLYGLRLALATPFPSSAVSQDRHLEQRQVSGKMVFCHFMV